MNLVLFFRLIKKYRWLVISLPTLTSLLIGLLTRHQPREYSANTLIYTGLASGYTLESNQNNRVDYFAVNNAFDNLINTLKAQSTLEEVGIRLLASHLMMTRPDPAQANPQTFAYLQATVPASVRQQIVVAGSLERTIEQIYRYAQIPKNIIAEKLLNAKEGPYSVKGITAKLNVKREGTSDMVRIEYVAHDPAVVKHTLELITTVFMRRYREMKVSETGNVVAYFQEQLSNATRKLSQSEERMKDFSSSNKIINYYEQTKYVSAQDRDIDLEIQKERSNLEASKAALQELDKRLSIRQDVALKSQEINNLRDSLSVYHSRLAVAEMNPTSSTGETRQLNNHIAQYESKARAAIGNLYQLNNSKNGVPAKMLFEDWIDAFVSVDKGEARLLVLSDIKQKYDRYYRQFAPLGSTMSRLEREIDVAEREYLEILHGLNQSKLREQNLLLATNLKVIDRPKFPDKPESSKGILLMLLGGIAAAVLAVGFVIAKAYFDQRLRTPARAEAATGLRFTGAVPLEAAHSQLQESGLTYRSLNQCLSKLKKWSNSQTQWVIVASARSGEGKTYFAEKLTEQLRHYQIKAVVKDWTNLAQCRELVYALDDPDDDPDALFADYQYVFIEIPALLQEPIPTEITQKASFTLWVSDATRVWSSADGFALKAYQDTTLTPIGLILNRVSPDDMEGIVGGSLSPTPPRRLGLSKPTLITAMSLIALILIAMTSYWVWNRRPPQNAVNVPKDSFQSDTIALSTAPVADTVWQAPIQEVSSPASPQTLPKEVIYYVVVGRFESQNSAQSLQHELAQGGYTSKMLPPDDEDNTYRLTAGAYRNYKAAQDQAASIGYILDLSTTVLKKEQ